ncbi:hypothetical protein A4A71_07790 [Nicoletella semolina]|nr:hypothetical protein [Nicoletella semolina]
MVAVGIWQKFAMGLFAKNDKIQPLVFFIEFHIFPILWYSHCFSSLAKTKNKIFTYFEHSRLTKYAGGGG